MNKAKSLILKDRNLLVIVALLLATYVVLALTLGPQFFTLSNFQSMAVQLAEFGLLSIAMGLAMLTGGIDLSIVSAAVLSGIVAAEILSGTLIEITDANRSSLILLAVGAALLVGLACGLFNGLLVAKVSVPPILATLATMIFYSGISMVLTNGSGVTIRVAQYTELSTITIAEIPLIFLVMCAFFLVIALVLARTRTGRTLYLYGENNVATRFSGLRSERTLIASYVVIGLLVAVAALIMISRTNSARVGFGDSYLLQTILVVVLAGFDPYGGRGRVLPLLFGLVLLQSLQSAFTILQFSGFAKQFLWGSMLLLVMALNRLMDHLSNRRMLKAAAAIAASAEPSEPSQKAAVS